MAGVRYYFYYVGYVAVKCKNELHFEFFCLKLTNSFRKPIKTDKYKPLCFWDEEKCL